MVARTALIVAEMGRGEALDIDAAKTARSMERPDSAAAGPVATASAAALWEFDWEHCGLGVEHVPLVFWLMETLHPCRVAVVGNGGRPAFLAACHAVERIGLPSTVFGAFTTQLPDEMDGQPGGKEWRRVGAQHRINAELAQDLLARAPVDLLLLDRSAAAIGGARAPELWQAALKGTAVLVLDARDAEGSVWSAALSGLAGTTVGRAHIVMFDSERESAISALNATLKEPETALLALYLERLGEGLATRYAAREAKSTAERLEIALAETAARGDIATAELVTARQEVSRLEEQLRTSELEAAAARQAVAEASTARQEVSRLEEQLRTSEAEAAAARRELPRLRDRLRTSAAEATAARQEIFLLEEQLRNSTTEASFRLAESEARVAAEHARSMDRVAAEHARSMDIEARLTAILGSTSWRLTQPLRATLHGSPRLAKLLRRTVKLAWWTVTFQLPVRYRLWQQARARAAVQLNPPTEPSPPPSVVSATALEVAPGRLGDLEHRKDATEATSAVGAALQRVDALERRAGTLESLIEMERGRIDWALGGIEGVTAMIDSYHADRETDNYRAAFASAAPLVSVCVATMDRAYELLDRSIASILAQSYRNIQVVVVGDNCTDDTERRLAALRDDRIQFVNLPERGPYPHPGLDRWYVAGSNAMNHALSLCEGQFITHLDDDDAMVPHRIETLIAAALESHADFLWHPLWCETADGVWIRLGNGRLELGQVSTGSIFYHHYFARFPWDVYAYRLGEPGDWNRLRKIKLLRPRLNYVDEPLLYHYAEQSQAPFVARAAERFLS